jgi:hypothetical protein
VGPQAGGGIVISGLPPRLAFLNGTYAPTEGLIQGYPGYSAGPKKHLSRHPELDLWCLSDEPFDPAADNAPAAYIPAAGGPVPTGKRAWSVAVGGKFVEHEVTAREVA